MVSKTNYCRVDMTLDKMEVNKIACYPVDIFKCDPLKSRLNRERGETKRAEQKTHNFLLHFRFDVTC